MGSCAAPSAKGDDKFITTDYLQQCRKMTIVSRLAKKGRFPVQMSFSEDGCTERQKPTAL
ncbi:hypothetical protein, partial [Salmonella sp. ZJHZ21_0198]|uniref:hypothetical protein n=1 Tax=Salmonella sp. ZJHZ21_0198 TaxID=3159605 RepID=UPI00397EBDF7